MALAQRTPSPGYRGVARRRGGRKAERPNGCGRNRCFGADLLSRTPSGPFQPVDEEVLPSQGRVAGNQLKRGRLGSSRPVRDARPGTTATLRNPPVHRTGLERQQRVDLARSPSRRRMAALCAKRPFVMARQTSLHHRSNQTRNRHGWRCLAERKLRLRVRQYGERYLWFESISLHHTVPANRRGFRAGRNPRNSGRLVRRVAVCEPNSGRSPAFCG